MSFDLRIHFTGLVMFVPDDRIPASKKLHVLLPSTAHHPDTDPMRHFPGLAFDTAYRNPNSIRPERKYDFVSLEGGLLNLASLPATPGIHLDLPAEIASLETVAKRVEKKHVDDPVAHPLAARVTLATGALTDCALGASYALGLVSQAFTDHAEWTIRGIESKVGGDPGLPKMALGNGQELPNLFPIGDTIHLGVVNVVFSEFPPDGVDYVIAEVKGPATHFEMYYEVCPPIGGTIIPQRGQPLLVQKGVGWPTKGSPQSPGATCIGVTALPQ